MGFLQEWARFTKSRTARHKLAKFLREHGHLLPEHYRALSFADNPSPSGRGKEGIDDRLSNGKAGTSKDKGQTVWLSVEGDVGPGLLAELAQIIDKHGHDVKVGPCSDAGFREVA